MPLCVYVCIYSSVCVSVSGVSGTCVLGNALMCVASSGHVTSGDGVILLDLSCHDFILISSNHGNIRLLVEWHF